jgi:uncharacterized RDD family membrane protein YckC
VRNAPAFYFVQLLIFTLQINAMETLDPYQPQTHPIATPRYAGFWARFFALVIDAIILGTAQGVLSLVLGVPMFGGMSLTSIDSDDVVTITQFSGALVAFQLMSIVASWLYFALMESSAKQATVGKMAVGMHVTDLNGNRISFARATGRYFAKYLSGIILLIGYIMAAFTPKKQALHDKLADTLVIADRED